MKPSESLEDRELEVIKKDEKVKRALNQTSRIVSKESGEASKNVNHFLGVTGAVFVVCAALYFLMEWKEFPISPSYLPILQKILISTMLISLVVMAARLTKKIFERKVEDKSTVFNFNRIIDFFGALLILIIVLSMLFANWYAAMVSFGIVSLVLGFALQNPITSFFGWLYILIRKPYEVGDRIRIGQVFGDVINVSYIDTTLWEFNGDYLSGDHPSGRTIRFANSKVFNEFVLNYSWPLFPFIWNELSFYISYDSDFKFASSKIKNIVESEIGEAMISRVKQFKKILAETPVDELNVNEFPSIILKAHNNTWIEVTIRYLVEPKNSGIIKQKLFDAVMVELKQHPDKVIFPNSKLA